MLINNTKKIAHVGFSPFSTEMLALCASKQHLSILAVTSLAFKGLKMCKFLWAASCILPVVSYLVPSSEMTRFVEMVRGMTIMSLHEHHHKGNLVFYASRAPDSHHSKPRVCYIRGAEDAVTERGGEMPCRSTEGIIMEPMLLTLDQSSKWPVSMSRMKWNSPLKWRRISQVPHGSSPTWLPRPSDGLSFWSKVGWGTEEGKRE